MKKIKSPKFGYCRLAIVRRLLNKFLFNLKAKTDFKKRLLAAFFLLAASSSVSAQTDDTNTRSITSTDFQTQRPKSAGKVGAGLKPTAKTLNAKRRKNIAVISSSKRRYNLVRKIPSKNPVAVKTPVKTDPNKSAVTTKPANTKILKSEELGVTFWRLRPKNEDEDDAPTFSVKMKDEIEKWTAERVGSRTSFRKGDRVRFTIESSRTGYIYIVNREFYKDGTTGQAEIIFPTLRTRSGGDNSVIAGSLIEIPGSEVAFPYYNVNPKRADYAGEEILVIITPQKLPGIEIGLRALAIKDEMVRKWIEDWSAETEIFDAEDGEGVAYTQEEAQAATSGSRALTQEEPLPQTIYRLKIGADSPLVVAFQMQAQTL